MGGLRCPIPMLRKKSQRPGIHACRASSRHARSISAAQRQTAGFRGLPAHHVTRRRRDVGRLSAKGAISHLGHPGQLIFCTRVGPRARTFETHQNRAISLTGTREDLGALMRHVRIPQLRISRFCWRVAQPFFCSKELHSFPRRCLPGCWRCRFQAHGFLCPRSVCILAHSGAEAPIALSWNLNEALRESPNLE